MKPKGIGKLPKKWQNTLTVTKSGCWLVPNVSLNNKGYALGWDPRPKSEGGQKVGTKHRIAWKVVTGKKIGKDKNGIPKELHHECRHQLCINPDHAKIVTKEQHQKIHAAD